MKRLSISVAFFTLLFGAAASMQAQMQMPKPAPELKNLDYFVGTWTTDGDMKPGPMGPGGKMTSTGHSEWMDGGFFLVIHSDFKGSMGNGTSAAVMGYNSDEKAYTYDEYNSMGEAEHSQGRLDGDTWTWGADEKMGGQTMKGRFTMKILSPTSYSFKYELSSDGAQWTTVMDGKTTKSK